MAVKHLIVRIMQLSQYVAMSLTALIYNHQNTIVSSRDLQNVMNFGNELCTSLSRLSKQTYLLLVMDINHIFAKETMFTENIALTLEPISFIC